ncbi:MAG: DEAD/DEAH box helicase family protein [Deltaproteobacteria bacterium]|nr:DEAD/DEAH box helicase family protein [Deltaproteobacteria bacterium]
MQLKEFQQRTLVEVRSYLEHLAMLRDKVRKIGDPDLAVDFCIKAWEKARVPRPYVPRKNGLKEPLPAFCLKIPTGGGKTLLAVKTLDLVNMIYRKRKTGLVLWIVPTTQIYRQTIKSLKDRDHPYRQHLDLASGGRTVILEKADRFTPLDVEENLVALMLMLPSANRQTKETLKVFKDSGGFQDFFPREDDVKAQERLLGAYPNLDTYEKQSGFWGRQIKTSLGNTLRLLSPVIILDEGHKAYSAGAQETLRGFNPSLLVELSATPAEHSNILVDITGRELHREEMIKLDLHIVNKASPDWRDTLRTAFDKLGALADKAVENEANSGTHIRPICLIQVERTGSDQQGGKWIHSEQVKEHLIKSLGVPPEQIAIKTSEKDELKEVDDTGGLLSRECPVRFIITKQALQEGWDCSFAYVLVVLTNPSSRNSLTQLVGRILRQPFARKTHVRGLDESYVFCFQQKANALLDSIRNGFAGEGLGDLRGHVVLEDDAGAGAPAEGELFPIREKFREAAAKTILPVFVVRHGRSWRPLSYEMDIAARVDWGQADLDPVLQLTLAGCEEKDVEIGVTLVDDRHRLIGETVSTALKEGGIKVDSVFMTRQLCDIVPNPWQAHEFSRRVLDHFRKTLGGDVDRQLATNFVFIIEETRRRLESEKERLSERVFQDMLAADELRFLVIGKEIGWRFPSKVPIPKNAMRLVGERGQQLELLLHEAVSADEFNESEKTVAWYLEDQARFFFWFRNRSRHDYSVQGWRQHKIYPDFIFTTRSGESSFPDYDRVYVVETKGIHLRDNAKTDYIRRVFDICTKQARSRSWNELGLEMKDKIVRFEVIAEGELEVRLNEMISR